MDVLHEYFSTPALEFAGFGPCIASTRTGADAGGRGADGRAGGGEAGRGGAAGAGPEVCTEPPPSKPKLVGGMASGIRNTPATSGVVSGIEAGCALQHLAAPLCRERAIERFNFIEIRQINAGRRHCLDGFNHGAARVRVIVQDVPWVVVPHAFAELPEPTQLAGLGRQRRDLVDQVEALRRREFVGTRLSRARPAVVAREVAAQRDLPHREAWTRPPIDRARVEQRQRAPRLGHDRQRDPWPLAAEERFAFLGEKRIAHLHRGPVTAGGGQQRVAGADLRVGDQLVDLVGEGVDVAYFTDAYSQIGIEEGLFQPVDRAKLPNLAGVYDIGKAPQGDYGPAYTVGRVGIIYDTAKIKTPIASWNDLWREDLKGQLSLPGITTTSALGILSNRSA